MVKSIIKIMVKKRMERLKIKALSVNEAWKGKRYKTPLYKRYEADLGLLLPCVDVPEADKLQIHYIFGLSSKRADYDNCIKQFQDIISKKYNFNDNRIYKAIIEKVDVKKNEEFIKFKIEKYV